MPPKKPADQPEQSEAPPKLKIPPRIVLSDDCTVYVDREITDGVITNQGTPYKVHEGEWVEINPARSMAEMMAMSDIQGEGAFDELCVRLSERLFSWTWTNNASEPMAQPYKNPAVLKQITDDELMWLLAASKGQETSTERKND